MELTIKITPGEDGFFVAEVAELPGCMSQGGTIKEALANVADAIESVVRMDGGQDDGRDFSKPYEP